MAPIFAFIVHKAGVAGRDGGGAAGGGTEDRCGAAADRDGHRLGCGTRHGVREPARTYGEIWRIANEALAYPNAELVRQALVQFCRAAVSCWFRMRTWARISHRGFRSSWTRRMCPT